MLKDASHGDRLSEELAFVNYQSEINTETFSKLREWGVAVAAVRVGLGIVMGGGLKLCSVASEDKLCRYHRWLDG